jgi:membrane fusion protein, multidrug efflux system
MITKLVLGAALVTGAIALSACGRSESHSLNEAVRRTVDIRVATPGAERVAYELPGELVSRDRIELATKVAGRVLHIPVKEGMRVKRGDLLVELDVPELQSAWAQSQATEAAARANADASEHQAERFRRLAASQVVTARDLELVEVATAGAKASYAQAKSASDMNRKNLEYAVLRAPRDGVIVEKKINPGDLVLPGATLLIMEDSDNLEVRATLPVEMERGIAPGDSAFLVSSLDPSAPVPAVVDRVSPNADDHVIVAYFNASRLRAPTGTFVKVTLFSRDHATSLRLPESAILHRGPLTGVFAVRDGRAVLRWLRLGEDSSIAAGLAAGDSFLVAPPADLEDGDRVEAAR